MKFPLLGAILAVRIAVARGVYNLHEVGNGTQVDLKTNKFPTLTLRDNEPTPTYCGTFKFHCNEKNAPACNNACFFHYCRNGDKNYPTYTRASSAEKTGNGYDAGCKNMPPDERDRWGSPCNYDLFAKKFSVPQNLKKPSCDEWPPASVKLNRGAHPPSLRCMEESQNNGECWDRCIVFIFPPVLCLSH